MITTNLEEDRLPGMMILFMYICTVKPFWKCLHISDGQPRLTVHDYRNKTTEIKKI